MPPDDAHPAALPEQELLKDCQTRRGRRSGPGGQHRNKVETCVTITHAPTGIQGEASERRSQQQNRRQALFRLRVNLALKHRTQRRAGPVPSILWRSRANGGRIAVSGEHDDFPALLAEALDVLADHEFDVAATATQLQVSTSQLVKFLKIQPRALEQVNDQRSERALGPLR